MLAGGVGSWCPALPTATISVVSHRILAATSAREKRPEPSGVPGRSQELLRGQSEGLAISRLGRRLCWRSLIAGQANWGRMCSNRSRIGDRSPHPAGLSLVDLHGQTAWWL